MDTNSILTSIGVSTSISTIITLIYHILQKINGKMVHSKCCDHDIEMGVEVVNMSQKNETISNDRATNQSDSKRDETPR
jgi:hypothetical protein